MEPNLIQVDNNTSLTASELDSLTPEIAGGEITAESIREHLGDSRKMVFTFRVETGDSDAAYEACEEHVLELLDSEPQSTEPVHVERLVNEDGELEDRYIITVGVTQ